MLITDDKANKAVILRSEVQTPIGPMVACATDLGLCLLEFTDRRRLEAAVVDLQQRLKAVIVNGENEHITQAKAELAEYFAGQRTSFSVPLHTPTTPFRQQVWDTLVQIPFGATASYAEQAHRLGKPKAVRAVANANGHNRVAIIIPCHRVIGSDGSLTGYAGGLHRKEWLLTHEGVLPPQRQRSLFDI